MRIPNLLVLASLAAVTPVSQAQLFVQNADDRARIAQAVPRQALVKPAKPRRLLIFTLNVGYGGHASMAYANEAFSLMGKQTGAFDTEVSQDPKVFEIESLRRFDAVFFNNTVGNCFTNVQLRRNLLGFVTGGGGLLGVHGTTVAFTQWPGAIEDWPEFGFLIGARGANHKDSTEHIWINRDDPDHLLTAVFGTGGFDYRDEFFRPQDPYSRDRVRVLLSIDTVKTDVKAGQPRGNCIRADNDYALAWIRNYGRGRIFYSTIAHNPYVFWDPKMLQFYLAALQFALGDLQVPTTPSARLSPAMRAQEKLGWRLGLGSPRPGVGTFFEAIDRAAQIGLPYVQASDDLPVSAGLDKKLGPRLTDEELSLVRLKLEAAGVRVVAFAASDFPGSVAACGKLFEFGRKLGIETFLCDAPPAVLELAQPFCDQYGISIALCGGTAAGAPGSQSQEALLGRCRGRSNRIGVCADTTSWAAAGLDPVKAVRKLKDRLLTIELGGLDPAGTERFLAEIHRLGLRPTLFALDLTEGGSNFKSAAAARIESFNRACLKLAAAKPRTTSGFSSRRGVQTRSESHIDRRDAKSAEKTAACGSKNSPAQVPTLPVAAR